MAAASAGPLAAASSADTSATAWVVASGRVASSGTIAVAAASTGLVPRCKQALADQ